MLWNLQLHDQIQVKSNNARINNIHYDIAIGRHIMRFNCVWNLILGTKFSSIYLAKGKKRLVLQLSFVYLQRVKDGTHMFQNIDIRVSCINLTKSYAWYHTSLIIFPMIYLLKLIAKKCYCFWWSTWLFSIKFPSNLDYLPPSSAGRQVIVSTH